MSKVELLSPAGNIDKLKIALLYGADAVYIGGKNYSLRANAKNFTNSEIKEACNYAHKFGKKVYVTVNIVFHNQDFKGLIEYLQFLSACHVDAIISSDPSIIEIIQENNIKLAVHLSTQMSTANQESALFWKKQGVERVVLARECSKADIKAIIDNAKIEVECFLHGAMCSAYSGRCVLSNYFTNRDSNRGACAQICRWCFELNDGFTDIKDDTKFTMSVKDLSLIDNLEELIELGVSSLKVEGRMRSDYYIATVISTYRNAIDDYYNHNLTPKKIEYYRLILNRVANRENTSQFFAKLPGVDEQYFLGRQEISNQDFLGIVLSYDEHTKILTLTQRNYFKPGDKVEFFGPNIENFKIKIPYEIYDEDDNLITVANHPKQIVKFKVDKKLYKNDIMRVDFVSNNL